MVVHKLGFLQYQTYLFTSASGKLLFQMLKTDFQEPSGCSFLISTYFPSP